MNVLKTKYKDFLDILALPTNNFGMQEPGHNDEILNGLKYVRPGHGFEPLYKVAEKSDANGENANPIFVWLRNECEAPNNIIGDSKDLFYSPLARDDISWNFEKFLIDQTGKPFKRYSPDTPVADIEIDIQLLAVTLE